MLRIEEEATFRLGQKFAIQAANSPEGLSANKFRQSPEWHLNLDTLGLYNLSWLTLQDYDQIKNMVYADPKTLKFIQRSFEDQAHLKEAAMRTIPKGSLRWERDLNILGLYLLTPLNLEHVGLIYEQSRASISLVIKRSLTNLWRKSSSETRRQYPVDQLVSKKSGTGQRNLDKNSVIFTAMQELTSGFLVKDVIRKYPGISQHDRTTLYKRARELQIPTYLHWKEIAEAINNAESDQEVMELFDMVGYNFFANFPDIFIPLTKADRRISPRNASVAFKILTFTGISVKSTSRMINHRQVHYYYVRRKDIQRIDDIVSGTDLKGPDVQRWGPRLDSPPTTTVLQKGIGFLSLRQLIKDMGLIPPTSYQGLLSEDCEVPVFIRYRTVCVIAEKDRVKMENYLRVRLGI